MGEEKLSKLAIKLSVPMIISMMSMAIYNIVDTAFISSLGGKMLLSISICFPLQVLISAISLGTGIGINSYLSKTLGENNKKKATNIIYNGIFLGIISFIVICIFLNNYCLYKFFEIFTKDIEVIHLGIEYLHIIVIFSIFNIFQNIFSKILESYGKASLSMISQFIGIILNIILDPILIYGISGKLCFGIEGAAIATVIGRALSCIFSLFCLIKEKDIDISLSEKIDSNTIYMIYKVGFPTIILESVAPVITIILNNILVKFSENAVSLYGIYYKLQSFIFMIISGLNYGMIPIVAYNLGAKKKERVKETINLFLKVSFVVTLIGTILFMLIPRQIISIFSTDSNILNIGEISFRIFAIGFIFAGQSFVLSSVFQAIGNGKKSLIIFLLRKAILPFLFIIIFINKLGLSSIWIGFTVAEVITLFISYLFYKREKLDV